MKCIPLVEHHPKYQKAFSFVDNCWNQTNKVDKSMLILCSRCSVHCLAVPPLHLSPVHGCPVGES